MWGIVLWLSICLHTLLHLLTPECGDVKSEKEFGMLLHVIIHFVFIGLSVVVFFRLLTFFFLLLFVHEVLFLTIVFIEFYLLLFAKLLPDVGSANLG